MLTDKACRAAAPRASLYKMFDGGGLFLAVLPSGFKSWRFKYRYQKSEKQLTIGPYPQISLKEARLHREEAKSQLLAGIDPSSAKKQEAPAHAGTSDAETSFKASALRWHKLMTKRWKARHAANVMASLEREVFPHLGERHINDVKKQDVRKIIEAMQERGSVDQAHRVLRRIFDIYELAAVRDSHYDERKANPAASLKVILAPIPKRKYRAITNLDKARSALIGYEQENHYPTTKLASRLLALTAARPGTIRFAEKQEFHRLDSSTPSWIIPAAKLKLEREEAEQDVFDFEVPLSRQAVEVVRIAMAMAEGSKYLFPSIYRFTRPISENALNKSYRDSPHFLGKHVPHGWRSTFSTIMNERAEELDNPADRAIIDLMLAHKPQGVEATYNRAAYMPRRRILAQEWADLISEGLIDPEELAAL